MKVYDAGWWNMLLLASGILLSPLTHGAGRRPIRLRSFDKPVTLKQCQGTLSLSRISPLVFRTQPGSRCDRLELLIRGEVDHQSLTPHSTVSIYDPSSIEKISLFSGSEVVEEFEMGEVGGIGALMNRCHGLVTLTRVKKILVSAKAATCNGLAISTDWEFQSIAYDSNTGSHPKSGFNLEILIDEPKDKKEVRLVRVYSSTEPRLKDQFQFKTQDLR